MTTWVLKIAIFIFVRLFGVLQSLCKNLLCWLEYRIWSISLTSPIYFNTSAFPTMYPVLQSVQENSFPKLPMVMVLSNIPGILAKLVIFYWSYTSFEYTSSERTLTLGYFCNIYEILKNSWYLYTFPVGFEGLFNTIIFVFWVNDFSN